MSKKSSNKNDNSFPDFSKELKLPENIDRRTFLIRNAVIGAAAAMTGTVWTIEARAAQAAKEAAEKSPLPALDSTTMSQDLDVVKRSKGPVMTVLDEFYKVGPGPSSSHTIGPMRITYDFYQRCTKLPADQLKQATGLKVHLFGSLSATGKGHGTERAALAGLLGKEPATVDPLFLDEMRDKPNQSYSVKLGDKTFNLSLADVIYDTPNGDFPHPNTMTCKLMGGDKAIYELEYYSPGGGFYEWKGYTPPKKGQPKYPYETMKELRQHAEKNNLSIAQLMMANELAVSGKTEEQINAFLDKIAAAMLATVKAGLDVKEGVLPGPIKLHSKAAEVWKRAQDDKYEADRAVALLSACALAASEENARGHLVITAPTGGSAGVMPAIVYGLTQTKRALPQEKVRQGLLAGAAIGYLCKHNATLSGAEGDRRPARARDGASVVRRRGDRARVGTSVAVGGLRDVLRRALDTRGKGRGRLSRRARKPSRRRAGRHHRPPSARDRYVADGLHAAPQREQLPEGRVRAVDAPPRARRQRLLPRDQELLCRAPSRQRDERRPARRTRAVIGTVARTVLRSVAAPPGLRPALARLGVRRE